VTFAAPSSIAVPRVAAAHTPGSERVVDANESGRGRCWASATANAPDPVTHRQRRPAGKVLLRWPTPRDASVSGRGMKTPGATCSSTAERHRPIGCNGTRCERAAMTYDSVRRLFAGRLINVSRPRSVPAQWRRPTLASQRAESTRFGEKLRQPIDCAPAERHACCSPRLLVGAPSASQRIQVTVTPDRDCVP